MSPEYLLFIDTETTGLPRRWHQPYTQERAWPSIAQLAWVVYTVAGELVKEEQAYLQIPPGRMPAAAVAIHGLTPEFLAVHGQESELILRRLLDDLETYQPRVIAHFLQLDFHVLGAAFERAGLPNPLPALPQFCTLTFTLQLPDNHRYLRLHELHERLFGQPMARLHDAYLDADATARCFFELQQRGLLPESVVAGQPLLVVPAAAPRRVARRWLAGLGVVALLCILYWLIYG